MKAKLESCIAAVEMSQSLTTEHWTAASLTKDNEPFAIKKAVHVPPSLGQVGGVPPDIPLSPAIPHQVAAVHPPHIVVAGVGKHPELITIYSRIVAGGKLWWNGTSAGVQPTSWTHGPAVQADSMMFGFVVFQFAAVTCADT